MVFRWGCWFDCVCLVSAWLLVYDRVVLLVFWLLVILVVACYECLLARLCVIL